MYVQVVASGDDIESVCLILLGNLKESCPSDVDTGRQLPREAVVSEICAVMYESCTLSHSPSLEYFMWVCKGVVVISDKMTTKSYENGSRNSDSTQVRIEVQISNRCSWSPYDAFGGVLQDDFTDILTVFCLNWLGPVLPDALVNPTVLEQKVFVALVQGNFLVALGAVPQSRVE